MASSTQMSESFRLSAILSLSGGLQDAYTYNVRGNVFANAQTGNVVLMAQHLMLRQWKNAIHYLFPLLSFTIGIFIAEMIGHRLKHTKWIHWRQIILLIEIALLGAVGFLPDQYNMIANMIVSFTCAMQVQSFQKVHGYGYASTMCIGNLRSGTESFSQYLRSRDKRLRIKAAHYFGIVMIFALGAGIGGVLSQTFGIRTVWICDVLLLINCLIMNRSA